MNCSTACSCPDPSHFQIDEWRLAHEASLSVINLWDHILLSFRECESFNCSCPSGLTISHHDGRMYISELRDSLTVREIDGSQSELSLRPGPNKEFFHCIYYARICSDDRIVVQDESGNLISFISAVVVSCMMRRSRVVLNDGLCLCHPLQY